MNDIIVGKSQSIQKCIARARQELTAAGDGFASDYTRQDAAVLNITRACEQAIDLANHLIKKLKLGVPSDSGGSFDLLNQDNIISGKLAQSLKKMIGFRNIAVHEYQEINIDVVISVIREDSQDLVTFTEIALKYADE